jgi:type I restriction enzyme M protein
MITAGTLKSQIDKLWETFWTGGISNPMTVIEQITYLMYIKRMDEEQTKLEKKANRLGKPIQNPLFTEAEYPLRWSQFRDKDPDVMFALFRQGVEVADREFKNTFDKMKEMGAEGSPFREFMKGATFMIGEPRLLDSAVQMIDKIDQNDRDTKGDLYEYLLSKIASAGQNGQFRTPRHIIKMMVEMMQPTVKDRVCDPSAGTMGFLVATVEYLEKHYQNELSNAETKAHYETEMFNALEFDPSMIRIGAMNLMQHGVNTPNLHLINSLSKNAAHFTNVYDLILANPPFKGSVDKDNIDESITNIVSSTKSELLFLGLMLRMLKIGGRAAVIVPDGVLFGSSNAHKAIRKTIIETHQLQAVISMPSGVFKPYAGVSTGILIFTKTNSGGTDKVWFYDMQADGLSLDDKRNELDQHQHDQNNIPDILNRWNDLDGEAERQRTEQSFLVPMSEIVGNDYDLSINRYKQIVYEAMEYKKPQTLIERIEATDKKRMELLANLKQLLANQEIFGV